LAKAERTEAELRALMKLSFILDTAGESVLGKGAPALMYQAGRDAGLGDGEMHGETTDIMRALELVLDEGDEVWQVDLWREPGASDVWVEGGETLSAWLVFKRCPLLTLARSAGSTPGGMLCQALHGYMAGSMEAMLSRRVDMRVGHCGPRACKIMLELRR
jgi:predicted hydrocarbon binding protein